VIFNKHGVRRRAGVVGIDTRLWAGGTGVRISAGVIDFQTYVQFIQTDSTAHSVSFTRGTGVLSEGKGGR